MAHHIMIPLDATDRDVAALHLAATSALSTGAAITLALPHNPLILDRLRAYAEGENLTLADAADLYVARAAARLWNVGVLTEAVSWPSFDIAGDLAGYAHRHDVDTVLVIDADAQQRHMWRRTLSTRLATKTTVPVVAVPVETIDLDSANPPAVVVERLLDTRPLQRIA